MIAVNNLIKAYNGNVVVNIPQLATRQGEIIGLVGNNGAGKTTFFRLILDLVRADRGEMDHAAVRLHNLREWRDPFGG